MGPDRTPPPLHPMAAAMNWVARVFAAGLVMVLPGLAGQWLDERLGTGFLALCGFGVGICVSIFYLVKITAPQTQRGLRKTGTSDPATPTVMEHGPEGAQNKDQTLEETRDC